MIRIIETLREDHRNIEELLLVLEQELSVFDRNERPDYEIMQAVITYFEDYPDCCHHPKEDMIFEKLKARDPVAAESVGDLEAEHQNERKRLRRVADTIRSILTNHEILRQSFDHVMHDFIERERKHMEMEERFLFSAAANALRAEDWQESTRGGAIGRIRCSTWLLKKNVSHPRAYFALAAGKPGYLDNASRRFHRRKTNIRTGQKIDFVFTKSSGSADKASQFHGRAGSSEQRALASRGGGRLKPVPTSQSSS